MSDRTLLHIRKTGGMAIKSALRPYADGRSIVLGQHDLTLVDVPAGAKAFFCVRHPCQRFVSGFNSRLRKGQPRNFREWTDDEAWAFGRFATPNALAEALSDDALRADAERAMVGITHTGLKLSYWLLSASYVRRRWADILWIGHQPSLSEDFAALKRLLGLPADVALPDDDVDAHRTPEGFDTELSATGDANIAHWYRKDFEIYTACLELRQTLLAEAASG